MLPTLLVLMHDSAHTSMAPWRSRPLSLHALWLLQAASKVMIRMLSRTYVHVQL